MASQSGGFQPGTSKYCSGCAASLHVSAVACPHCGAVLASAPGEKNRVLAVILALLLGGIGVHKFYLGRVGWGVVYILFCWTLIPSIAALIEGLMYAFMSEQDFHAKYG
jgi:TM2 domain-containing membrane protein YozV